MSRVFHELRELSDRRGPSAAVERFIGVCRNEKRPHELFEALKLKARLDHGLTAFAIEGEELDVAIRHPLEDAMLEGCREVGTMLMEAGRFREGWMFLRPVGDRLAAAQALQAANVTDENRDEFIELLLYEGIDTRRGFEMFLESRGVCPAITAFDQIMAQRPAKDRQAAAGILVRRLHADLLTAIRYDLERRFSKSLPESSEPGAGSIVKIIKEHPEAVAEGAYHLDTTHLSAVVRMGRSLEDKHDLTLALELAEYGAMLSSQYQYPGEEPFSDNYVDHAAFYRTLLGQDVDEGLARFKAKAHSQELREQGTQPIEVYLELLSRVGRKAEALETALALIPEQSPSLAYAPLLLSLCQTSSDWERVLKYCETRNDLLGYLIALSGRQERK